MVTTVTYEELDRLFYERLRLATVAAGLTVDETLYLNGATYQTARDALRTSLAVQNKRLVEVIGVGTWDDKDETHDARIVVMRGSRTAGGIGSSYLTYHESYKDNNGNDKFNKFRYPDSSDNVAYEVRCITNNVNMERALSKIVDKALGRSRYMQTVGSNGSFTSNYVQVSNQGSFDMSSQRYVEKTTRYLVEDVWLQEPELVATNIPAVSTVEFSLYLPDSQTVSTVFTLPVALPTPSSTLPLSLPFNV